MIFAFDTELSLVAAAALVNTARNGEEQLATEADLARFLDHHGFSGDRAGTRAELDAVRGIRGDIVAMWREAEADEVGTVNRVLADARAVPQLVRHDGMDWHPHATSPHDPLAIRILVEAAMAVLDAIRSGERERLKFCEAHDCDALLVDLSRNRSRRFCDTGNCANRMAAAAYRARKAGA